MQRCGVELNLTARPQNGPVQFNPRVRHEGIRDHVQHVRFLEREAVGFDVRHQLRQLVVRDVFQDWGFVGLGDFVPQVQRGGLGVWE
ncbi:JM8 [macacine gammaherpesvirus 11]|uniref:JM8 n=2 Tax=macacine gammaherpesvirus 11 TaxID=2560570 RepID=G9JM16_9GAMA|nr:JM8 [Macaca fuscata rhadinovirus]AAS99985.1 JM8 [Macaca fuscata rhadinovirus]AEW87533.1 JM8 [Macaca fuscata rhadinovirus]AEW87703.1 JM8 [Macaca fuscata rhadinovirus]